MSPAADTHVDSLPSVSVVPDPSTRDHIQVKRELVAPSQACKRPKFSTIMTPPKARCVSNRRGLDTTPDIVTPESKPLGTPVFTPTPPKHFPGKSEERSFSTSEVAKLRQVAVPKPSCKAHEAIMAVSMAPPSRKVETSAPCSRKSSPATPPAVPKTLGAPHPMQPQFPPAQAKPHPVPPPTVLQLPPTAPCPVPKPSRQAPSKVEPTSGESPIAKKPPTAASAGGPDLSEPPNEPTRSLALKPSDQALSKVEPTFVAETSQPSHVLPATAASAVGTNLSEPPNEPARSLVPKPSKQTPSKVEPSYVAGPSQPAITESQVLPAASAEGHIQSEPANEPTSKSASEATKPTPNAAKPSGQDQTETSVDPVPKAVNNAASKSVEDMGVHFQSELEKHIANLGSDNTHDALLEADQENDDPVRTWLCKMDDVQMKRQVEAAKRHPLLETFLRVEIGLSGEEVGLEASTFGSHDDMEELHSFYTWLAVADRPSAPTPPPAAVDPMPRSILKSSSGHPPKHDEIIIEDSLPDQHTPPAEVVPQQANNANTPSAKAVGAAPTPKVAPDVHRPKKVSFVEPCVAFPATPANATPPKAPCVAPPVAPPGTPLPATPAKATPLAPPPKANTAQPAAARGDIQVLPGGVSWQ